MPQVLIIGAGIGGTAAALALDKAGLAVAVCESHPDSGADIGAFLTLASNGMLALGQLDAARAVAEVGFALTSMRVVDDTGAELATVPLGEHDNPLTRFRCLRRAELAAALRSEAVRRGIPLWHGRRLDSVDEDADGVTARFADGSGERGELIVGADGINSVVRSLIDPAADPPRYAGQRVFYGYTTKAAPPSAPERIDMVRGSSAAFGYAVSPAGETYWFARVPGPELSAAELALPPAHWRAELVPLLRRDHTAAADIVAATDERLLVTNAQDVSTVRHWHTERMLLLGDAAHAASPATGQGASMALEDAVVLGKALRDRATTEKAVETYERLRRPRVEDNVAASARITAGRTTGQPRPAPAQPRPSMRDDVELMRQLDWNSQLG
ncbi:MAG TPA: FAD-dependent monooxygenase [Mycobacteriales bacterium]|nr:FAD-dependent monooxygenase [Mycobacteriales bacterium]